MQDKVICVSDTLQQNRLPCSQLDVTAGRRNTRVHRLWRAAGFKTREQPRSVCWGDRGSRRRRRVGCSAKRPAFHPLLGKTRAHKRDFTSATMWSTPHATSTTWPGTVTWQKITQRNWAYKRKVKHTWFNSCFSNLANGHKENSGTVCTATYSDGRRRDYFLSGSDSLYKWPWDFTLCHIEKECTLKCQMLKCPVGTS